MFVAGDNQIGPSGQGAGEHVVVVGIVLDHARHFLGRGHVGQAPLLRDDALRRQAGLRQARRELLTRENIEQFSQQRCAAAQLEDLRSYLIKQTARRAAWRDYPGNQRICIQHHPTDQARRAARS